MTRDSPFPTADGVARRVDLVAVAAAVVAVTPVVVATIRAVSRGWIPMGDNAYFTIRARDVLSEHHPLLGAWSSGSAGLGALVNNLGPLQLDLLALPVRIDGDAGTAVGVAVTNVLAVIAAIWAAQRTAGRPGVLAVAAAATGMSWTMGSELLFEPRQHHALVLPFLAVLVLAWAVAAGDVIALPVLAFAASLVVQTHLSFVAPTIVVVVAAIALGVRAMARHRRAVPGVAVTGAVVAVCWVQPLWQQLAPGRSETGNLSALASAAGEGDGGQGLGHGLRALATVVALPPWWGRPGFRDFEPAGGLVSPTAAALGVAGIGLVLLAGFSIRHRPGPGRVGPLLGITVAALVGAVVAASTTPSSEPFGPVSGNYRFLWPVGALVSVAAVVVLHRVLGRFGWAVEGATASCALVLAVLAVPTWYGSPGPEADAALIPVADRLRSGLTPLEGEGTLLIDRGGLWFGEPYTYVVLAELQRRGVPFVFEDDVDHRRFGSDRRVEGRPDGVVRLVGGDEALAPPDDGEATVTVVVGLDEADRAERTSLRTRRELEPGERRRLEELDERWERGTVAVRYRDLSPAGT